MQPDCSLQLLNNMAHGLIESPVDEESTRSQKPRVRGRLVSRGQWLELLKKANEGSLDRAKGHLASLIKQGILRVGLQLKCPTCSQANWFSPGGILDVIRCERCLRDFPFPALDPPSRGAWYYRSQGPFTVENYAQGGYACALALRFLISVLHAEATWVPGLEIAHSSGPVGEIDFGVWWRKSTFDASEPTLLLGESKSFNEFEARDVARAKRLSEQFPGATLVFATLRPELEAGEVGRLARLANAGRKQLKADKWRAPVLVLTSHELMSDMGPPYCWRDAGGKYAGFAENYRGFGGLNELCDATQQLHLGMEPYGQWRQEEFERRRKRRLRSRGKRVGRNGGV